MFQFNIIFTPNGGIFEKCMSVRFCVFVCDKFALGEYSVEYSVCVCSLVSFVWAKEWFAGWAVLNAPSVKMLL